MERTLMAARRALVVLIVMLTAVGLGTLLLQVLAPGGWTLPKMAMLVAFAGTASWTGLCLANGLIGFVVLVFARDPIDAVFPSAGETVKDTLPRTAIAVTVRNEDMRLVLQPLRRLLHDLDRLECGDSFTL